MCAARVYCDAVRWAVGTDPAPHRCHGFIRQFWASCQNRLVGSSTVVRVGDTLELLGYGHCSGVFCRPWVCVCVWFGKCSRQLGLASIAQSRHQVASGHCAHWATAGPVRCPVIRGGCHCCLCPPQNRVFRGFLVLGRGLSLPSRGLLYMWYTALLAAHKGRETLKKFSLELSLELLYAGHGTRRRGPVRIYAHSEPAVSFGV